MIEKNLVLRVTARGCGHGQGALNLEGTGETHAVSMTAIQFPISICPGTGTPINLAASSQGRSPGSSSGRLVDSLRKLPGWYGRDSMRRFD